MSKKESFFGDVRKHLMSGVSFMLPVIIVYAFFMLLGQIPGPLGELCANLSELAKTFIGPILGAYIAYSIVGKLALAPTFIVGLLSEQMGMGFIGGLIVGLLMGYIIKLLKVIAGKFKQGQLNDILTSYIVVPIVATLAGGALVYFLIANPVIAGLESAYKWLESMSTGNAVLLAAILGAMIAFDMGGPVNKVAYTFALAASTEGLYHVVAPVLVAITIPVLAVGLSTIIFKKNYDEDERIAGKTALFMSIFGFTEGAIPFAVINPFRVIPAFMVGSAAGAALAAIVGLYNTSIMPSLMGLFLGSETVGNGLLYVLCHVVGVVVTIAMLLLLHKKEDDELELEEE
ncbi:MAG: PTS fructose transporter subunit IIC [Eubacteriales bacterium]